MKKVNELTVDEANEIFGLLMDSHLQDQLMQDEQHPNRWMLDYVFDSKLRNELEKQFLNDFEKELVQ